MSVPFDISQLYTPPASQPDLGALLGQRAQQPAVQVAAKPNTLFNLNPAYFAPLEGNSQLHMTPEQLIDLAMQVEGTGDHVLGGQIRGQAAVLLDPAKSMRVRRYGQ